MTGGGRAHGRDRIGGQRHDHVGRQVWAVDGDHATMWALGGSQPYECFQREVRMFDDQRPRVPHLAVLRDEAFENL